MGGEPSTSLLPLPDPYFQDDSVTIYQGEALAILSRLPTASVDAVIADPPYSSGGAMRSDRMNTPGKKYADSDAQMPDFSGDNRDQRAYGYWSALWLSEALRVTKPGGLVFIWTDWRQLPTVTDAIQAGGWMWRGLVTWHKPASRPMTGRFSLDCEYVVWGSSGVLPAHNHVHPSSLFSLSPEREREHVAQKPEGVARHLLQLVPRGGIVLDPFTGTGSTLGAAKSEGYHCIGIEIEQRYCEIAAKRCAQETLRAELEPEPVYVQETIEDAA